LWAISFATLPNRWVVSPRPFLSQRSCGLVSPPGEVTESEDPELSPRANFIAEHIGIALGVVIFRR
jgi:predicted NUDIX family NTP pyrophosphohydrolase